VAAARSDDATTLALAALAFSALGRRHDLALVMVERALAQTPSSAIAHTVIALVSMMLGRPEEAERHAERSLRLSPFDPLRHLPESILGAAKLAAGDTEAALLHIHKSREANPLFAPNLTTLAVCLLRLGRLEEACATVQLLLEIAPDTRLANLEERYLFANALGFERIAAELRSAGMPE